MCFYNFLIIVLLLFMYYVNVPMSLVGLFILSELASEVKLLFALIKLATLIVVVRYDRF